MAWCGGSPVAKADLGGLFIVRGMVIELRAQIRSDEIETSSLPLLSRNEFQLRPGA